MNKNLLFLILALSICFLSFRDNNIPKYRMFNDKVIQRSDGALYVKGKINIKFKNHIQLANSTSFGIGGIDKIIQQYSLTKIYQRYPVHLKRFSGDEDLSKIYTFFYNSSIDPTDLSETLLNENKDIIEWIEPDFVYAADYVPNDPSTNLQYHISKINSFQAWDLSKGDTNVVIGIVDSGSDLDHPDLGANIKYNYADPINNIDDDNNGYIDDFAGWDFYYGDNNPNIQGTGNTHGSHVSGDASQVTDNAVHGAGIGFKCKLRISKHTDDVDPEGLLYSTNDGLVYCYSNGCKIINCSFGSSSPSSFTQNIVDNAWAAGTIIVASAGNGNPVGLEQIRYPAAYNHVVCVAATNNNDIKASFSHYHDTVDVSAPGENILSTVFNNAYAQFSGTSMSSPITAGTVGLIRSRYPSWTPQQVVDRLELGVDSIYNLNPGYIGKLGSGRINAFKCLADKPIISLINYSPSDSLYGNNDKVFDANEKVTITFSYKNTWLSASNVSLRLTSADPDIQIVKDSLFAGNLNAYTTYSTVVTNTFEVMAKTSCAYDKEITFKLAWSGTAYTDDNANTMKFKFRQGWATHTVNNMKLSLTKDGAVGKKTEAYGSGLVVTGVSGNQIYEGGLMIGISNTKVSDDCRRGSSPTNISDTDFTALSGYTLTTPGLISSQDGSGMFNDNGAGTNKIGVEVRAKSYAFTTANDLNYILLKYTIKNTSGAAINNMHAGMYMFFSPEGVTTSTMSKLDAANKLGYSFNPASPNVYLGVSLLTPQTLKFQGMQGIEVLSGFTTDEKWTALSSGVIDTLTQTGLTCFVLSAGPVNLNNNDSTIVSFAILKGSSLADLQSTANTAKNKYNGLIGISQISATVPKNYELNQNYPNPFNPLTKIKFGLPENDFVNLTVYDVTGRAVATLINMKMEKGYYEYDFDGNNISSGVYFYRMNTSKFSDVKKMILLK